MIKEALQYLFERGVKASPSVVTTEAEPGHVYYLRKIDGSLDRVVAAPKPRENVAADLGAIVELAAENKATAEIWYSRHGVKLYLDRTNRRDVVTFKPEISAQIKALAELERTKQKFTNAELIKLLRINFHGALRGDLIPIIRKVKFQAAQSGESDIQHGKVSIGKSQMAQVTGTDALPEDFSLLIPPFANACFMSVRSNVELALEPDATTQTFQVIPYSQEIENCIANGEAWIGNQLIAMLKDAKAPDVTVLYGNG